MKQHFILFLGNSHRKDSAKHDVQNKNLWFVFSKFDSVVNVKGVQLHRLDLALQYMFDNHQKRKRFSLLLFILNPNDLFSL